MSHHAHDVNAGCRQDWRRGAATNLDKNVFTGAYARTHRHVWGHAVADWQSQYTSHYMQSPFSTDGGKTVFERDLSEVPPYE